MRIPWPWDGEPDPLDGIPCEIALPALPRPPLAAHSVDGGEYDCRESMEELAASAVAEGFSASSAIDHARSAARRWHRGVDDGSIKPARK